MLTGDKLHSLCFLGVRTLYDASDRARVWVTEKTLCTWSTGSIQGSVWVRVRIKMRKGFRSTTRRRVCNELLLSHHVIFRVIVAVDDGGTY